MGSAASRASKGTFEKSTLPQKILLVPFQETALATKVVKGVLGRIGDSHHDLLGCSSTAHFSERTSSDPNLSSRSPSRK